MNDEAWGPEPAPEPARASTPPARRRLLNIVGELNGSTLVIALVTLIVAPLQARALGPAGRGMLAAVLVPLSFAPLLIGLGIDQYAARETARGRDLDVLIGSVGLLTVSLAAVGALLGPSVAHLIGHGRRVVEEYLQIGFFTLPLVMGVNLLLMIHGGLERWRSIIVARLIPPLSVLVAIVALYLADALTAATAALVAIIATLLAVIPLVGILRGRHLRLDRRMMRDSIAFGLTAWVGAIGTGLNFRLDQLVMTRAVSERELGLYAVAATLSTAAVLLTHDVGPAIFPRVASGEYHLAARALRVTLPVVVGVGVALGALTIPILTIFFGRAFLHAAPMTWILLGSMVPLAGTALLGRALVACGAPGPVLRSELLGLGVTALGLVLLLPSLGGIGAAIVSIAAYSVNFAFLLRAAQARLGGRVADYLVPRREDLRWASATVQELLATRLGVKLGRSRDR